MELGDLDIGESFFLQPGLEGLLDIVLTVNDEERFDLFWILACEELTEIFVISVSTHAADTSYFCVDLVKDAEDMYFFCSGH